MAFASGTTTGTTAEINVTPLIDVLLVLLIIFMVIVPVVPRGLSSLLPQPPKVARSDTSEGPVVVQVHVSPAGVVSYELNQRSVAKLNLVQELDQLLAVRQDKTVFVQGDRQLEFATVAEVIDCGRQAAADRIDILTAGTESH